MRKDVSTIRSRYVGSVLARAIEHRGLLAQDIAEQMGWSAPKMSRLLHGRYRLTPADVATLLAVCGITAGPVRASVVELAADLASPMWLQEHGERPPIESPFVREMEHAAVHVVCWGAVVVPALLQTAGYTTALCRANPVLIDREVSGRVEAHTERQQVLHRVAAPEVLAFLGAPGLTHSAFPRAVMAEQAEHLIGLSGLPNVRIRIVPEGAPERYASNPFQLLHFDGPAPVVHEENLNTTLLSQRPATVAGYQKLVARLDECALSVEESWALLMRAATRSKNGTLQEKVLDRRASGFIGTPRDEVQSKG